MNRPVHFEIHAVDCVRAMKFYTDVFGWQFKKWEATPQEYYLITTGDKTQPGIDGGLLKRFGAQDPVNQAAVNAFICTMDVVNIDETIKKAKAAGGTEALPKFAMPGLAWLAYYKDTEGNIFGIYQEDKNAK
jgi:predicted enzyme related to lactoylglutathione lyase